MYLATKLYPKTSILITSNYGRRASSVIFCRELSSTNRSGLLTHRNGRNTWPFTWRTIERFPRWQLCAIPAHGCWFVLRHMVLVRVVRTRRVILTKSNDKVLVWCYAEIRLRWPAKPNIEPFFARAGEVFRYGTTQAIVQSSVNLLVRCRGK
jgi:hypothetical protein